MYGLDLHGCVDVLSETKDVDASRWRGLGYVQCYQALMSQRSPNHPEVFWKQTEALVDILHTPEDYLEELQEIIER